jgi:SAM-dependent methyltransferase
MTITPAQIEAGQAVYTKALLRLYDLLVLGISNRLIWRCPTHHLLRLYDRHVTSNHLDVGVGTGFFLDRCRFPAGMPRLALVDLNPNCLEATARRVARYRPEVYRANVLEPLALDIKKFDSIGLNYLLHCLPGTIESKGAVFNHLNALLNPGGVIFGATLLHEGVSRNWAARRIMALYNRKGIFTNVHDGLDGLRQVLARQFSRVTVDVIGCAALFSARP